jgi:thiol:disulfide interchange protein
LGAHLSARAPGGLVRRALAFVLLASALKLLHVPNRDTAIILAIVLVFAPVLWMLVRRRHGFPPLARRSRRKPKSTKPAS